MDNQNPYNAPQSTISHDARDAAIEYVGFWPRVGAHIIDTILTLMVTMPILYFIYGEKYFLPPADGSLSHGIIEIIVSYIFPMIAIILFWIYKSATPGKMVIHAKIVDVDTLQPTTSLRLIGRYFAYIVSTITLLIGFFWIGFDKRKQGFHDKIVKTTVIRSYD